mgnify:FL=1
MTEVANIKKKIDWHVSNKNRDKILRSPLKTSLVRWTKSGHISEVFNELSDRYVF